MLSILVPSFAKHVPTQVLVIAKWKKKNFERLFVCDVIRPYCLKLATEALEKSKV